MSAFDSADKLTYQYTAGTPLREDTTLFALWRSDAEEGLAVPEVSVTSSGVSWEAVSGAKVYDVTITAPNGLTQAFRNLQTTSQSYDFSAEEAGEYAVMVTASAANSAEGDPNAVTATRYFNNKALAAVSSFTVVKPSALVFEGVENAQSYYLTIECGNPAHRHEDVALGSSTNYNFSNCAMQEGGIRFTVRAEADGYAPSVSKTFVYNRALAQVTGLTYDAATETVRWNAVADAMSYVVAVGNTVKDIGNVTSVTVPATYAGKPVTDIFSGAFRGCEELEEINLPNSLQTVGSVSSGESTGAFAGCTALRAINVYEVEGSHEVRYFSEDGVLLENSPQTGNVTIAYFPMARTGDYVFPDGVQEISAYTFTRAAISSVTIPDSVLFVRQRAFYYCLDLAEVNFAAGGTDGLLLEQYAFQGSVSLEEITLPARMTSVELASALFDGCDALENIYVEAGSANYFSVDGLLCDETGATLLYYPSGRTGAFTVPVTITAIGDGAFAGHKGLTQVTIGAYVQSVGEGAFKGCVGLTSVEFASAAIPQEMTIGEGAFRDCAYLERVTFGENSNVTSIGGYAFSGCRRLEAFTIPETVTEIGTYAFENCATLEEITLTGQSVTVGNYAFSGCESLDSVSIGTSVESFNFILVFNDCAAITTVNVDPNNAFFATYDDVLYNKDLTTLIFCPRGRTEVSIADSTLVIGDNAFESCQITDVTLPDGVTTIGASAFYFSQLEQINIPASVATISDRAFYFCQHLQKVDFEERHDQPLKLGTYLFNSCSELESLVLPEGVTELGSSAFSNCKSLTELELPASVVTVSAGAFTGCAALSLTVDQANTHLTVQNGVLYENRSSALGDDTARQHLRRLHRIEGSRHQRSHYLHRQLRVPQYRDHVVHDRQQRDVRRILRLQWVRGAHLARL